MSDYSIPVKLLNRIVDKYGSAITLTGEDGDQHEYHVVYEFQFNQQCYVALQTKVMKKQHEVDFYKVIEHNDELEIVTIDNDDEWEEVSEAYDDIIFAQVKFPE